MNALSESNEVVCSMLQLLLLNVTEADLRPDLAQN
jgi:hypothetical protein